jgi:hypothetical protein
MLFDTEARRDVGIRSLRAVAGAQPDWRGLGSTTAHGSHAWVEVVYPRAPGSTVVEVEVVVGGMHERLTAALPAVPGT